MDSARSGSMRPASAASRAALSGTRQEGRAPGGATSAGQGEGESRRITFATGRAPKSRTASKSGRPRTIRSMGKVVELDAGREGAHRRRNGARAPRRRSKTALVLGGGGFTGGVYEIGALRALDLLSVNRTVNQFDVYVGTSAGSLRRVVRGQRRHARGDDAGGQPTRCPRRSATSTSARCCALNYRDFARLGAAAAVPRGAGRARVSRASSAQVSAVDLVGRARRGAAIRALHGRRASSSTSRTVLSDPDRSNDFRMLANELYLAATDLDTCERIVFGAEGWDDVPISTRRARLDRAADDLQARQGARPRARRRRHRLDHEHRHRRRGGREVRRRHQPARALRQRLRAARRRRSSARARGASRTWASRRSATRRSS